MFSQLKQLHEALACVQTEKEALLSEQSAAEEVKKLLSTISSLRAEGDELRKNLQARVDQVTVLCFYVVKLHTSPYILEFLPDNPVKTTRYTNFQEAT